MPIFRSIDNLVQKAVPAFDGIREQSGINLSIITYGLSAAAVGYLGYAVAEHAVKKSNYRKDVEAFLNSEYGQK